ATNQTPAQIAASLTGKTLAAVNEERAGGKAYGTIAKEAGKLTEFQAQVLEQKKAILDERVKAGSITQAQADQIYAAIKNNQATCAGSGAGIGRGCGTGFGQGSCGGMGIGRGLGAGKGWGAGCGTGWGLGSEAGSGSSN
ncbi:MAG TPA: DUF2680 domain-containing protein, partial [Bacillota bacterium]|nr:DUF2680 domain-containing protein [Bacillota bacterium]